jgi:hypothetical protein
MILRLRNEVFPTLQGGSLPLLKISVMRNGIAMMPCPRSASAKLTNNILLGVLNDSLMYTAPITSRLPINDSAVTTSMTSRVNISPLLILPVPTGDKVVDVKGGEVTFSMWVIGIMVETLEVTFVIVNS